ncbi:hypothetical protein MRX96_010643 [Rhipicephalus microplus]
MRTSNRQDTCSQDVANVISPFSQQCARPTSEVRHLTVAVTAASGALCAGEAALAGPTPEAMHAPLECGRACACVIHCIHGGGLRSMKPPSFHRGGACRPEAALHKTRGAIIPPIEFGAGMGR